MRIVIGLCWTMALAVAVSSASDSKPAKSKRGTTERAGVHTPGVQIPFASLKPDAEFSVAPDWMALAGEVWIPDSSKDGVNPIDAKSGQLGQPVSGLGKPCGGVVSAFGSLWVPDCAGQKIDRIDSKTHKVTAAIATGVASGQPVITADADSVWALTDAKTTLSRIDPQQNQVVAELRLPAGCEDLAFGEAALWVACPASNQVFRVDPRTNLVDQRITVSAEPRALAIGEGSIWVLCTKDGNVDRIDPKTNQVAKSIELGVPGVQGGIAAGAGSVWVTLSGFPVTRIDPNANRVVQQFYGSAGGAILVGEGWVWLSNRSQGSLWRLDPKRIAATLAE